MQQQHQERTEGIGNALQRFLAAGRVEVSLDGMPVRIIFASLPGRTVCVATHDEDGVLWIACDDAEPWARGHVAEMLADGFLEEGDGYFEVTALPKIPTQRTRDHLRLALVD